MVGIIPYGSAGGVSIIPALGGPPIFTATLGYSPVWSADSQHLAFAQRNEDGSVDLGVFDLVSRARRILLTRTSPGVPPQPVASNTDQTSLLAAWAPAGDRLAVASFTNAGDGGWVGLLAASGGGPDGPGLKLLPAARGNLAPDGLAYSADGRYLAVSLAGGDSAGTQGVAMYADGALVRWLPGYLAGPWSPTGHILPLIGLDGVSLLREPAAAPRAIGPAGCTGLAWKP